MTARIPHPYRIEDAERYLSAVLAVGAQERVWGVELDFENGPALAGAVSLAPSDDPAEREIGYWIGRPFWGRGIATTACRRVLRNAFEEGEVEQVIACVFHDNAASRRVLEKLGFSHRVAQDCDAECLARGAATPALNWALRRAAFKAEEKST